MGNVGAGCLRQLKNKEGVASKFASKVNVTCIFLIVIYNRKNRHKTKRNKKIVWMKSRETLRHSRAAQGVLKVWCKSASPWSHD